MSWFAAISHLLLFSLLLLAWRGRASKDPATADPFPLALAGLILFFCDMGEAIPYELLVRLFPEEGFIETAEVFLCVLCSVALILAFFIPGSGRYGKAYLFFAFIFFWIILEEISYGASYLHISDPGPVMKSLILFSRTETLSDLGTWAVLLSLFVNGLMISLMLSTACILFSPDLSLATFLHPRTLPGVFRKRYKGLDGLVLLAPRLLILLFFNFGRHLLPSMTGFAEEQIEQFIFLLCAAAYTAGIVLPRRLRGRPRLLPTRPQCSLPRLALPLFMAGWLLLLFFTVGIPMLRSIPADRLPADPGIEACADDIVLEKVLAYRSQGNIVLEGMLYNVGQDYIDVRSLKVVVYDPAGQTLDVGRFDPYHILTGEPLSIFAMESLAPGKRQFFQTVIDRAGDAARLGLSIEHCAFGGD
ncbi:hypothetical protein ACFL4G_04860 [Thermodesulfobacteriota bacterium]